MRLTIRHRYPFGADRQHVGDQLVRPDAWDALRLSSTGPFAAPQDRGALESQIEGNPDLLGRAVAIDAELEKLGATRVASYGAGTGLVEGALLRVAPNRELVLSEYAPGTVERLRETFPDAVVEHVDLLADPPLKADAHLFHRVDTDLDDDQWRGVFRRFASCPVVVVAGDLLDLRSAWVQLRRRMMRGTTSAGWLRTPSSFEALWRETHTWTRTRFHDHDGWVLLPRHEPAAG